MSSVMRTVQLIAALSAAGGAADVMRERGVPTKRSGVVPVALGIYRQQRKRKAKFAASTRDAARRAKRQAKAHKKRAQAKRRRV